MRHAMTHWQVKHTLGAKLINAASNVVIKLVHQARYSFAKSGEECVQARLFFVLDILIIAT